MLMQDPRLFVVKGLMCRFKTKSKHDRSTSYTRPKNQMDHFKPRQSTRVARSKREKNTDNCIFTSGSRLAVVCCSNCIVPHHVGCMKSCKRSTDMWTNTELTSKGARWIPRRSAKASGGGKVPIGEGITELAQMYDMKLINTRQESLGGPRDPGA